MRIGKIAKTTILLLPLACLTVAGRQAASSMKTPERDLKDPKFIADGAKLFGPTCGSSYCHGPGGIGGGAPTLRGKGTTAAYLFRTISNGIPNTSMLSFKSELSEEQIWKVVAFILSDSNTAAPEGSGALSKVAPEIKVAVSTSDPAGANIVGDVRAGRALFFDSAQSRSCRGCHSFGDEGTPIGPDLSRVGAKSPRELFLSIILPHEVKEPRYSTLTVRLRNGDKIVGVKKEEDAESMRIYDTSELPAVLRTVQKSEITRVETSGASVMPGDYASSYSLKQLLDLVEFLKSSQSHSTVTLRDLFQK